MSEELQEQPEMEPEKAPSAPRPNMNEMVERLMRERRIKRLDSFRDDQEKHIERIMKEAEGFLARYDGIRVERIRDRTLLKEVAERILHSATKELEMVVEGSVNPQAGYSAIPDEGQEARVLYINDRFGLSLNHIPKDENERFRLFANLQDQEDAVPPAEA